MTAEVPLNDDFLDLLGEFVAAEVEFLVVGAHAMALHGVPRATGDLDLFVRPSEENAARVVGALRRFGAPVDSHGVGVADLSCPGLVYQLGLPPRRIDLLTEISGVTFDEAWSARRELSVSGLVLPFLGLAELLRNKRATGREKDWADLRLLEKLPK